MILPKNIREVYAKSTCIFSKTEVEQAFDKMAAEINAKFADSNPVLLCVVLGGIVTLGSLLTRLDFPLVIDYVHATRYNGATSGGEIIWKAKPKTDLTGRTVIIVDDILDGGLTLSSIIEYCHNNGAKAVFTAVLVDKQKPRLPGALEKADIHGLVVDDRYVFGYGLDYEEYLRNAPGIFAVASEKEFA